MARKTTASIQTRYLHNNSINVAQCKIRIRVATRHRFWRSRMRQATYSHPHTFPRRAAASDWRLGWPTKSLDSAGTWSANRSSMSIAARTCSGLALSSASKRVLKSSYFAWLTSVQNCKKPTIWNYVYLTLLLVSFNRRRIITLLATSYGSMFKTLVINTLWARCVSV